ncbi:MAG: protein-glutamine glutaminase family protein [Bdellovibrionota bacterium]
MRFAVTLLSGLLFTACANETSSPVAPPVVCASPTTAPIVERSPFSAARFANENWESLADQASLEPAVPSALTSRAKAIPFSKGYDRALLPEWRGSLADLTAAFEAARDDARYVDRSHREFKRRASWLYPYDGCASRAAHVTRTLVKFGHAPPAKIFAFGNLRVRTPYQRGGSAFWWYHTAPAVRLGRATFVFDPSVEQKRALSLEEWLSRMSKHPEKVRLAICDANSFDAQSVCLQGGVDQDREYESNIRSYLLLEWKNLESLGFDAEKILGSSPPWTEEATSTDTPKEDQCRPLATVSH